MSVTKEEFEHLEGQLALHLAVLCMLINRETPDFIESLEGAILNDQSASAISDSKHVVEGFKSEARNLVKFRNMAGG